MAQITVENPNARRKAVYYTGSDTLNEGEPLCYSFQTTKNWFGYSDSSSAVGNETTEGSHNEGKYIYVESPMVASTTTATWTQATKLLTDNGAEFDNLHVGMFVSVASATDSDIDGNWEITAQSAANNTITLGNMTDTEAAAVTDAISDVTVKIDNISAFAGVVAAGGWCGQAGPRLVEIYVPNGAIVPVRNDQNCVLGRTVLAVNSNEQYLTAPLVSNARPVAIAYETVDTATTTGLVLAKLDPNMFIYQKGDTGSLLIDDQDTGNMALNRIRVTTAKTTGSFCAFECRAYATGGAYANSTAGGGLAAWFRAESSATLAASLNAVHINLNLTGGTLTSGVRAALHCKLYTSGATLTSGRLCVLNLDSSVNDTTTAANTHAWMYLENNGSSAPDGLFIVGSIGDVGGSGAASVTVSAKIAFIVGSTTYYIPCGTVTG